VIVELTAQPDVVAVIPTLGANLARLQKCIAALMASDTPRRLAIVVVWNDPRQPVPTFESVTVLEPGMNLGFPGALNHARRWINSEFLWVMQDDVRVEPTCLEHLWSRISAPDEPAMVAPVYLDGDGLIPATCRAGIIGIDGEMDVAFPTVSSAPENFDRSQRLDWVASSGALTRLAPWDQIGGWDADFFPLDWSDIDFGYRLTRAGFLTVLEPYAHIKHDRRGSTPSLLSRYLSERHSRRFREKNLAGLHTGEELPAGDGAAENHVEVGIVGHRGVTHEQAQQVARAASLGLIDFATYATAAWNEQQREIRSFRFVRPIHAVRAVVRRLRRALKSTRPGQ
jgi:N-acetylglucosaminyl-diphospho-decaprenol L-rhamnosyltransferase